MYNLNLLKPIKSAKTMNIILNYFSHPKMEMKDNDLNIKYSKKHAL